MAKKTTPGLREALRAVNALGRSQTREADADYAVAASASAAGQANLTKQTQALTRGLVLSNKQNRLAVEAQAARGLGALAQVGEQQSASVARYGTALSGAASTAYGPARAAAVAQAKLLAGQASQAGKAANIAKTMAAITQQGVAAQGQASQYALAQALQQRAIIDNQTLASLTGDLYSQAMQYNMQLSLAEQERKAAERAAEREGRTEAKAAVDAMLAESPQLVNDAVGQYRAWVEEHRDDPNATLVIGELVEKWAAQNGYQAGDPRIEVFTATLRNLVHGQPTDEAFTNAMNTLYANAPGWQNWGPSTVSAGIAAAGADFMRYQMLTPEQYTTKPSGSTYTPSENKTVGGIGRSEGSPTTISGGDELWNLDWWLHPQSYGYQNWADSLNPFS